MSIDRREFLAATAALAATTAITPSRAGAITDPPGDDPLGVRGDFPVASSRTYLNSAYITPSPRQSIAAGQAFLESKSQPLTVGALFAKVEKVRVQFARLVNASPEEIGFVYGTTEGENLVANTVPMAPGDNVVIDELSYEGAFVVYRELEKRRGIELRIVRHRDGAVPASDFEPVVDRRTRLVSIAWVSHLNGFRHEMGAIADIAHARGALLHTDAIQAVGMLPVDVRAADVDFLCCGTYKWLLGGFGLAPFYIKRELLDRIPMDHFGVFQVSKDLPDYRFELETTAKRYEYATLPFAEVHQLGAGLAYLERVGVGRIEEHVVALGRRMQDGLLRQGYRLYTPPGNRSAVVSFYFTKPTADVRAAFEAAKVDVTVREDHVRASAALFNNTDEVDRLLAITQRLV